MFEKFSQKNKSIITYTFKQQQQQPQQNNLVFITMPKAKFQ